MIALAAAAVIAGVTIAVVNATGTSHAHKQPAGSRSTHSSAPRGDLAVVASYLGMTRAQLRSALRAGKTLAGLAGSTSGKSATGLIAALVSAKAARLDAAVADGKLSKRQERARLAAMRRRATVEVNRPRGVVGSGGELAAAAGYLGVTPKKLHDQRLARSLAQIADATPGRSAAGLIEALMSAKKTSLAADVAAGSLSHADERKVLSALRRQLSAEVSR